LQEHLAKEPENSAIAMALGDLLLLPISSRTLVPTAELAGVAWLWATDQPANNWMNMDFDDSKWPQAMAPFGAEGPLRVIANSNWTTPDIWMRKSFDWQPASTEQTLELRLVHDDDVEVYLNGQQVFNLAGWTPEYLAYSLDAEALKTLHPGTNTLAVHCRQYSGDQWIDVGVCEMPFESSTQRHRAAAMKLTDPWTKLAAAYVILHDQPALEQLLKHHPGAAGGEFYAATENWEGAISEYSKLINSSTTDASLLLKRGEAYFSMEQFDLARADWRRAVELTPELAQMQFDRLRQAERWSEAAEFGLKLIEPNPEDTLMWLRIAAVLALTDNANAYPEFCSRMVQHFAESKLPETAERIIKASLLRADSVDLAKLPGDLLAKSLDDGTVPEWLLPWGWGSRALLAYRHGDAESAVQYVAKSEEYKPIDVAHAMNLALVAMAQRQLGKAREAKTALEEASQLIIRLKGDPGRKGDHDLLIAEILFHEAEGLMKQKEQAKESGGAAK
jgi:tetratricopeptide (TPR) repeat protein